MSAEFHSQFGSGVWRHDSREGTNFVAHHRHQLVLVDRLMMMAYLVMVYEYGTDSSSMTKSVASSVDEAEWTMKPYEPWW